MRNSWLCLVLYGCSLPALAAQFACPSPTERSIGNQVGNGGKVVVCRNPNGSLTWSKLLDFYEGNCLYNLDVKISSLGVLPKVMEALDRLSPFDPLQAHRFKKMAEEFFQNSNFVGPLNETADSEEIVAPPRGCKTEQAITQVKVVFPGDKLYNIDPTIWNDAAFSDSDRAGLLLHEIIYTDALAKGHKNSRAVRYLNMQLMSGVVSNLTQEDYVTVMRALNLTSLRWESSKKERKWTYHDTVELEWNGAKNACKNLSETVLPSAKDLQEFGNELRTSTLLPYLSVQNEAKEFWTQTKDAEENTVSIGVWNGKKFEIYQRPQNHVASTLCLLKQELEN